MILKTFFIVLTIFFLKKFFLSKNRVILTYYVNQFLIALKAK